MIRDMDQVDSEENLGATPMSTGDSTPISVANIVVSYNTRDLTLVCQRSVYEQTQEMTFEVEIVTGCFLLIKSETWESLGGIGPEGNKGVYRFKRGMGGIEVRWNGPFELLGRTMRGRMTMRTIQIAGRVRTLLSQRGA